MEAVTQPDLFGSHPTISIKTAQLMVAKWHYLGSMQHVFLYLHVCDDDGVIAFQNGPSNIHRMFGLPSNQVCELSRIALRPGHDKPVTYHIARALRGLRERLPRYRVVVSYADLSRHKGTIYRAGNWVDLGTVGSSTYMLVDGQRLHERRLHHLYGTRSIDKLAALGIRAEKVPGTPKRKFAWGMTPTWRRRLRRDFAAKKEG